MPYRKVALPAGINREGTQYSAEGNWYDCDLIRFRQGRPEKIGGWAKYSSNEFLGISRSMINWVSIGGANLMAVGSDKKLYVELGGVYHDITPMDYKSQGTLTTPAGIDDAVTVAIFDFVVAIGDVIRMGSDANSVGDELMIVGGSNTAIGADITIERGSLNTTASSHAVNDGAFLLQKISNPIYLIDSLTTVLIHYPEHGLTSGDFINFLKIASDPTNGTPVTREDLYYPAHASVPSINGYDTTRSTQSFPVTKVLTSDYFEIRIATAPTGLLSSTLSAGITSASTSISLPVNTFSINDYVRIGDEYVKLTGSPVGSDPYTYTFDRSQFGSMSADHSLGAAVNEVGSSGSGQGGDTIIMRDIQSSESTFTEFSGWGAGTWGGIPTATTSTALSSDLAAGAITASVPSTAGFGADDATGTMLIESEIILYTVNGGSGFDALDRGANGTADVLHSSGTSVFLVDQYWTAWGDPTVPLADSSTALNVWSLDNVGELLIAAKDRSKPYYWDTPLKMSGGYPYSTSATSSVDYASGIMLADAVPLSLYPPKLDAQGVPILEGYGGVPEQVGFIMAYPTTRQVIAFGATDTFDIYDPMLIRWSDTHAYGTWTPILSNLAGGHNIQNGSRIIAGARAHGGIVIWTDKALHLMQVVNSNDVFNFREISDSISIASRHAHKVADGVNYWMGDNNFHAYDGKIVRDLECSVLSKVFDDLNYSKRETITCALNSLFNEIIWFYPSSDSDEPNRYVSLNYADQTWAYGGMPRTGWSDAGIRENPNAAYNKGEYTSGVYEGISRSIVYNQEIGYLDDLVKMDSYVETGFMDAEDGDVSMFIDRVVPDFRAIGDVSPELTISVSAKDYPFSSSSKTVSVNTDLTTEYENLRLRGRTISLKFGDSSSTVHSAGWQLGDPRIRMKPDGER
jgi:hypothetical protein